MNLAFEQVDLDLALMTLMLQLTAQQKKIDVVVGVVRGGLIPAVHISHLLNVPLVTMTWQTREEAYQTPIQDTFTDDFKEEMFKGKTVLVVDDICDTGRTFEAIEKQIPGAIFYSIFYKTQSSFRPNFYYEEDNTDAWIDFFWEHPNGTI